MIQSMTAFASRTGQLGATGWSWDMRGVNARGLDLRLRLPDGLDGLEAAARTRLAARLSRGNVSLNLRVVRDETAQTMRLDVAQLDRVLDLLDQVEARALDKELSLARPSVAEVFAMRGVVVQSAPEADNPAPLVAALTADLDALIDDFVAMRRTEGAALATVLAGHLDTIATLTEDATTAAAARRDEAQANLTAALRRVVRDVPEVDPARVAQELALLAVKADVTEELDRLRAHVAAARALLADPAPAGRKLDFLAQEFNREANTLCSKAGSAALTAIGLDLKAVIDQMREQVQNVE
ncbi:MAG: YicC family protein [Limimaricola sp.]|uniref:YicC/YloC family endoribonuclease n=1 Tax=Limimaricola sp. TaxID=2211665 RepID=UPI001D4A2499|nr:YicC/YloC family endoribonuclease [Limimaricola sp.]MBI1418093.1 YicC family protein [Limimaricola sp.]